MRGVRMHLYRRIRWNRNRVFVSQWQNNRWKLEFKITLVKNYT